jgi:hypothetical protein
MAYQDDDDSMRQAAKQGGALSRRQALTAAGLLAAGTGVASAQTTSGTQTSGRLVGDAPGPANAVEFRARFVQTGRSGEDFAAFGYLTRAQGAVDDDLFAGAVHNETTALLTAYAAGNLVQRTLDRSVHSLDIEGALTVYQRVSAGASFNAPDSFQVGTPVARFELTLQDILTVFVPGRGIPTLTGAMRQTLADSLAGPTAGRRFGHIGSRARFFATGVGDLVDPVTLNAVLEMAGNWVVE